MAKTPAGGKSLWDVGFKSIGIDEGWEGCGKGVNGTQHDAKGEHTSPRATDVGDGPLALPRCWCWRWHWRWVWARWPPAQPAAERATAVDIGNPVVNTQKFPDMAALVAYGHSRNVNMGL